MRQASRMSRRSPSRGRALGALPIFGLALGRLVLVALVALGLLSGCGANVSVRYAYDRTGAFSSYRTFAMLEPNKPVPSQRADEDPFELQRLRQLTHAGLRARGLTAADKAEADLVVVVLVGMKQRVEVRTMSYPSYPGYRYRGPGFGYDIQEVEEGTVAIDLIDRKRNAVVWRGTGVRRVIERLSDEEMQEVIGRILEGSLPGRS